ncbi:MAG: hypothetical protein ABIJ39_01145 [Chloroflexota bacterium]
MVAKDATIMVSGSVTSIVTDALTGVIGENDWFVLDVVETALAWDATSGWFRGREPQPEPGSGHDQSIGLARHVSSKPSTRVDTLA